MMSDTKMSRHNVVVTGATGYLGGKLVEVLDSLGHEVHVLERTGRPPRQGRTVLPIHVVRHAAPATAQDAVTLFAEIAPTVVFHLAAMFRAVHAADEVESLIESNLAMGVRIAEALERNGGGTMVVAGTLWQCADSKAYNPACLYAALKQGQEDVLRHYAINGRIRVVNVRVCDVYGPHDPRPRLLSALLNASSPGGEPVELTEGHQLIDLLHVDDAVQGLLRAANVRHQKVHGLNIPSTYSLSGGSAISVRGLVAVVERLLGKTIPISFGRKPYRQWEMFTQWDAGPPPPGWQPTLDLEEGLRGVIEAHGR
jgi:nucleoside-diphosphate-sugar epimerase